MYVSWELLGRSAAQKIAQVSLSHGTMSQNIQERVYDLQDQLAEK